MTRNEIRKHVFKIVFQMEFTQTESFEETMELYLETNEINKTKDREEILSKCRNLLEKREEVDECLSSQLVGWTIKRLGKAELAILRIAFYELMFEKEEIPPAVSINEAVEFAKEYCDEKAYKMINAVLSQYVNK